MNDSLNFSAATVAKNIRQAREKRNYTQDYLAAKLAISQNAYSKIELGYTKITIDRLHHIAQVLEVDMFELIKTTNAEITSIVNKAV
jgi:transcriptional regulator with XRE-family HTH domain